MVERLGRAERRRLLKEDEAFLGQPLAVGDTYNVRLEQANIRHIALLLLDTARKRRASAAADAVIRLYSATLAKHQTGPIACAKGCHLCCHAFVSATIPEILRLAEQVRADAPRVEKIRHAGARASAIPQAERWRDKVSCPILEATVCSAYAVRPLACRTMLSTSLAACEGYYLRDTNEQIPMAPGAGETRGRIEIVLQAALALAGLPQQHYELTHALALALAEPDAEGRWLAGEPVFAGVAIDRYEAKNPDLNEWVRVMVETVRPTL